MKAAKADWEADSNGRLEMNYAMFYNAIFELVDMWCEASAQREPASFVGLEHQPCVGVFLWSTLPMLCAAFS